PPSDGTLLAEADAATQLRPPTKHEPPYAGDVNRSAHLGGEVHLGTLDPQDPSLEGDLATRPHFPHAAQRLVQGPDWFGVFNPHLGYLDGVPRPDAQDDPPLGQLLNRGQADGGERRISGVRIDDARRQSDGL